MNIDKSIGSISINRRSCAVLKYINGDVANTSIFKSIDLQDGLAENDFRNSVRRIYKRLNQLMQNNWTG